MKQLVIWTVVGILGGSTLTFLAMVAVDEIAYRRIQRRSHPKRSR